MKKFLIILGVVMFSLSLAGKGNAWKFNTHRDTVIKAFEFMETQGDANQKWIVQFLKYRGGSDIALRVGNKNGDTDNFRDTSIGGWWIGYRTNVGIFGFDVNYTSFWHFISMFRPGHFGNPYDGYSYRYSLDDGFWGLNGVIKSLLYNQDVRNEGNAGRTISNPENGQGVRSAYRFKYQLSESQKYYSTTPSSNYEDYQNIIFEPNSNSAAYWYGKALYGRTSTTVDSAHIEYLGHVFHMAGDACVTQHVWDTSDHNHVSYEGWVDDNRSNLHSASLIQQYVNECKSAFGISTPARYGELRIQDIILFFAGKAVNLPGPLYSKDYNLWQQVGSLEYAMSIAINIIILEKYVNDLYVAPAIRRY
jgi:hypothetical protein